RQPRPIPSVTYPGGTSQGDLQMEPRGGLQRSVELSCGFLAELMRPSLEVVTGHEHAGQMLTDCLRVWHSLGTQVHAPVPSCTHRVDQGQLVPRSQAHRGEVDAPAIEGH